MDNMAMQTKEKGDDPSQPQVSEDPSQPHVSEQTDTLESEEEVPTIPGNAEDEVPTIPGNAEEQEDPGATRDIRSWQDHPHSCSLCTWR